MIYLCLTLYVLGFVPAAALHEACSDISQPEHKVFMPFLFIGLWPAFALIIVLLQVKHSLEDGK